MRLRTVCQSVDNVVLLEFRDFTWKVGYLPHPNFKV